MKSYFENPSHIWSDKFEFSLKCIRKQYIYVFVHKMQTSIWDDWLDSGIEKALLESSYGSLSKIVWAMRLAHENYLNGRMDLSLWLIDTDSTGLCLPGNQDKAPSIYVSVVKNEQLYQVILLNFERATPTFQSSMRCYGYRYNTFGNEPKLWSMLHMLCEIR